MDFRFFWQKIVIHTRDGSEGSDLHNFQWFVNHFDPFCVIERKVPKEYYKFMLEDTQFVQGTSNRSIPFAHNTVQFLFDEEEDQE